ncbi:MAG: DHH family phosphoesterase [Deltaproteobacteria bacterium]
MKLTVKEKLNRFLEQFSSDDRVLILINADPDAIASAMAIKRLLWRKVQAVTISNINTIDRPDNIAMVELLGIKLVHINDLDVTRFTKKVLVDSQPNHNELFEKFQFDAVIDHHPDTHCRATFQDIRPKYGATATILTAYLRAAKIKPPTKLATALILAIKTDTSNFELQTIIEDVRAFQFLFRHSNKNLIRKIEQSDLKSDYLKYYKKALEIRRVRKGRVYVSLGPVTNPDVCVLIADFFMRVNSIKWSIVCGFHQRKMIIIFRNDGLNKNAGNVAEQGFGDIGSAGGRKSMARAEVPLSELKPRVNYKDDKKLMQWVINRIEKKATVTPTGKNR